MALDLDRIERTIDKLRTLLKKAPKRPSPEQVHDLRTETRRFDAAVEALSLDSRRNERRVLRGLKRLRKRAGKVRDMDVFTAHTATIHARYEQECVIELLEYLGAERYQHARKLHAAMQRDGAALRARLKRTRRHVQERLSSDGGSLSDGQSTIPTDAMASALRVAGELAAPARLDRHSLHAYRLKDHGPRCRLAREFRHISLAETRTCPRPDEQDAARLSSDFAATERTRVDREGQTRDTGPRSNGGDGLLTRRDDQRHADGRTGVASLRNGLNSRFSSSRTSSSDGGGSALLITRNTR